MRRSLLLVALSSLVLFRPSLAAAQFPIITDVSLIDVPGATTTFPFSINDRGQIVGAFVDSSGTHGFLRSNGQFTTIDAPAANYTVAHGINNTGQIVGTYRDNAGVFHGFLLAGSQFTTIDPPDSRSTELVGITDLGQILGRFTSTGGASANFLRTHRVFVPLAPSPSYIVRGLNSRGQIVGDLGGQDPEDRRGFRLEADGALADIGVSGTSFASGINMLGEVVGYAIVDFQRLPGFLLAYGTYTLIDVPGSWQTEPMAINNRHQIVGQYMDRSGVGNTNRTRGFLFTPPNTIADLSGSASPDGSRVPQDTVVFDSDLTPWTLGPGQEIWHSGSQAAGAYGSQILWYHGSIYVLGDDYNWWRWTGSTWAFAGPTDPSL